MQKTGIETNGNLGFGLRQTQKYGSVKQGHFVALGPGAMNCWLSK